MRQNRRHVSQIFFAQIGSIGALYLDQCLPSIVPAPAQNSLTLPITALSPDHNDDNSTQ